MVVIVAPDVGVDDLPEDKVGAHHQVWGDLALHTKVEVFGVRSGKVPD